MRAGLSSVNNTDIGQIAYNQADDSDGDGIDDALDNCVYTWQTPTRATATATA